MPIDASVGEARKAISVSARNSVEWGTPVLHMRSPDGVLFTIDGPTTSALKATGTYRTTPVQAVTPPAAPPAPAAPQQFVSPPAAPPSGPPAGSGVWKGVAIGGGLIVALVIGLIYWIVRDPSGPDTSMEWVVQFESADTNHHGGWRRADGSTCVWNSYEDGFNLPYVQVPSPEGETWLVSEAPQEFHKNDGTLDDSAEVHLFFKNKGGEVEAFAGDSGRRSNDIFGRHVTVTPKSGPIPAAGLPGCATEKP